MRVQQAIEQDLAAKTGLPVSVEDGLRAGLYRLLGTLFSHAPDSTLLDQIAAASGDDSILGRAVAALATAAGDTTPEAVYAEHEAVFVGLVQGEVVPYASHNITGFLYDRPLAHLRDDLDRLGLARADGAAEPEDGIASLCEVMAVLIEGSLGVTAGGDDQRTIFTAHMAPWVGQFCADLTAAPSALFYKAVAGLAQSFFEIEDEYISLSS